MEPEEVEYWVAEGIRRGWIEEPVCSTHDSFLTEEEAEQFWAGEDPCVVVMRIRDEC